MLDPIKIWQFQEENLFTQVKYKQNEDEEYEYVSAGKRYVKEMFELTTEEAEVIGKLRTERCNLNNYTHHYHKTYTNECTNGCNCIENVTHYLLHCKKYNKERRKLFKELKEISTYYDDNNNLNSIDILFPDNWQDPIDPNDGQIKYKMNLNLLDRVAILRAVVVYVRETKRFEGEFGI